MNCLKLTYNKTAFTTATFKQESTILYGSERLGVKLK